MQVSVEKIKELREKTGVGIMDCKKALMACEGNLDAALEVLRERGVSVAEKKKERALGNGLIESYIHAGGRVGAIVEMNCETDFVARTPEFKGLAHDIAMQVAAMAPKYVSPDDVPDGETPDEVCLLLQSFIKDPQKRIQDIIVENIAKVGENMGVRRFSRFELGD